MIPEPVDPKKIPFRLHRLTNSMSAHQGASVYQRQTCVFSGYDMVSSQFLPCLSGFPVSRTSQHGKTISASDSPPQVWDRPCKSGPKVWPTPIFAGKNFGCVFLSSFHLPGHDSVNRFAIKNLIKALTDLSTLPVQHCMLCAARCTAGADRSGLGSSRRAYPNSRIPSSHGKYLGVLTYISK